MEILFLSSSYKSSEKGLSKDKKAFCFIRCEQYLMKELGDEFN